jgi:Domain of unknown function (DUF5658)
MGYAEVQRADPAGAGAVRGIGGSQRRRPPLPRSYWLLVILFLGLQVGDIVTTNYALARPGVWEANPVMALYQAQLGALWWLPKAAIVAWICVAAPLTRRWWPMAFAVAYYGVLVASNLALL